MSSKVINVVGSGLAGSLVAHVLREANYAVRVIDDNDPHSASRASSNLYIDHWLKKFSSRDATVGLAVLERLFGDKIHKPFTTGLGYAAKVRHISPLDVLVRPDISGSVMEFNDDGSLQLSSDSAPLGGPTVLCMGYRINNLPLAEPVQIKVGHCALFHGQLEEDKGRIGMIAPYKHEKLYNIDSETIYYSDSLAVSPETYSKKMLVYKSNLLDRAKQNFKRLQMYDQPKLREYRIGYRPMAPGYDFGRLDRLGPGLWSLNGGGKNGLVAYAALAEQLREALK